MTNACPFGFKMRAISVIVTQKNGMCSNAWPDSTMSTLLERTGSRYGLRITTSTLAPALMSTPTYSQS
jgi:hypothetical protein